MRVVIQRVLESSVTVDGRCIGAIGPGMMILCGFEPADTEEDLAWTARKVAGLRIFDDADGVMNLPVTAVGGDILVVSQFPLMGCQSPHSFASSSVRMKSSPKVMGSRR